MSVPGYAAFLEPVEAALKATMDACTAPEPLRGAMAYSILAGGKRLRPVMLLAACAALGGSMKDAMPFACALEMIHTYSLIHDDLPAMDDDDLRRGRPTNHKVYGEGMAVLAGDGLLSLAFETMLSAARTPAHTEAMRRIAAAAGVTGMVAGQCVDLTCEREGRGGPEEIAYIHLHKTADMFIGAVTAGLALAEAGSERLAAGGEYARALGIAFQIEDDLLDIEGDAAALGKQTGMDAARGKLTWPGVFGIDAAKAAAREQTDKALAALSRMLPEGADDPFLKNLTLDLLSRDR